MEQKNIKRINFILLALEIPVVYFLTYFTLGLNEMLMEEFESHPYESFFGKIAIIYIFLLTINFSILFAIQLILHLKKKKKLNIFKCYAVNAFYLLLMISVTVTYKFLTEGYV